jgi:hypothetical protein
MMWALGNGMVARTLREVRGFNSFMKYDSRDSHTRSCQCRHGPARLSHPPMATSLHAGHPPVIVAANAITSVLRRVNLPFALCGEVAGSIYRGLGVAPLVS